MPSALFKPLRKFKERLDPLDFLRNLKLFQCIETLNGAIQSRSNIMKMIATQARRLPVLSSGGYRLQKPRIRLCRCFVLYFFLSPGTRHAIKINLFPFLQSRADPSHSPLQHAGLPSHLENHHCSGKVHHFLLALQLAKMFPGCKYTLTVPLTTALMT